LDQKAAERYAHIQFNSIVFCFLQEIIWSCL
jgi:hypothetical protein